MDHARYHRQTLLPGWGAEGQARLAAAHAVVVGVGALGSVIAEQLARAGVGRLTLIDRDIVEPSNLHRQTLFAERDASEGLPKAEAARRRLAEVNAGIDVRALVVDLTPGNAERLTDNAGVIVDGTDNFETRFTLNDVAVKRRTPYVYGGAVETRGMAMVVDPRDERLPCLRCLFREPPPVGSQPTCDTAGVLGPLIAVVGGVQAAEAIKLLLGLRDRVMRDLIEHELWANETRRVPLDGARDPLCPCCGAGRYAFLGSERGERPVTLCGRDAVQVTPTLGERVDLEALARRLSGHGAFTANRFLVRGTLSETGAELTVFADGRAIVGGVTDLGRARAIYARYVGA